MKIYYAHPICIYNSARERRELEYIRVKFEGAEIINPSDRKYHWQKATGDMDFFLGLADGCDVVVYSRLFGKVTAGVGLEVNRALRIGKPVYLLEGDTWTSTRTPVTAISRQATRDLYQKWWKRHR